MVDNTKANTFIVGELSAKQMAKRKTGKKNHKG
jgi:hypothetical protein